MYTAGLEEAWELFAPYLAGDSSGLALVVSTEPLGDAARTAVLKSVQAFGYGEDACTFATLDPAAQAAGSASDSAANPADGPASGPAANSADDRPASGPAANSADDPSANPAANLADRPAANPAANPAAVPRLSDPQALFLLVESLDPLFLVVCDSAAARQLEAAYRAELSPDAANRLFGRDAVVFRDLSALMGTPRDKQRAWTLLKSLPRNGAR